MNKCIDKNLEDLSIIVPTFNRHKHLTRLLSYLTSFSFSYKIIVLDSSTNYDQFENVNKLLKFNKSIIHLKFKYDIWWCNKIFNGLQTVNTKYSVVCSDDDFIIPNNLYEMLNFLENHSDYSSVHGIYFVHNNAEEKKININQLYSLSVSDKSNTAIDRFAEMNINNTIGINP